jgi:DNA-binding beta-propeller fold protein YncE
MNHRCWAFVVLIALGIANGVGRSTGGTDAQSPSSPARAASDVPKFQVDPGWPKVPPKWQFGQVASVSVDAQDHVWILQRPGTLRPEEKPKAAPPVIEFDASGSVVQAWGGPGQGYEWPESEHGVYVDPKGFVWVGGNGARDHHVLKFTRAGQFVMQIGRAGQSKGNADTLNLNQPADTFVYTKTNELFVADGYGNRRVIVFDADTGKFKRMWGAFGNVPTDDAPNPALPDADEKGAPQFVQPVHATRVSNDGLVYVSDRAGKRVQVFTLDGKYVSQVFIGRDCKAPDCGNGTTAASTAFSTDSGQRYLYVGNRSQAKVMVLDRNTLTVLDEFGQWGSAPGQFGTLHHMAADSNGNLYVTEVTPLKPENRRVQKFTLLNRSSTPTR